MCYDVFDCDCIFLGILWYALGVLLILSDFCENLCRFYRHFFNPYAEDKSK